MEYRIQQNRESKILVSALLRMALKNEASSDKVHAYMC